VDEDVCENALLNDDGSASAEASNYLTRREWTTVGANEEDQVDHRDAVSDFSSVADASGYDFECGPDLERRGPPALPCAKSNQPIDVCSKAPMAVSTAEMMLVSFAALVNAAKISFRGR
jgi:hypothetical protein